MTWLINLIIALFKAPAVLVTPVPPVSKVPANPSEVPWMVWMRSHIGQHEIAGSADNPFIVAMFKHTTYGKAKDETPWCAAAVCTALEENGYKSTKSAAAISYKNYGTACELKPGCIIVIEHLDGSHHVTFCDHVIDRSMVACLGGNQSNSIKISNYNTLTNKIIATRWPVK
jgi:uncharacterized protein (TIGR02594 family)